MRRDHYPDKLQDITYKGDKEGVWAQNRFNKIEVHNEQKTIFIFVRSKFGCGTKLGDLKHKNTLNTKGNMFNQNRSLSSSVISSSERLNALNASNDTWNDCCP